MVRRKKKAVWQSDRGARSHHPTPHQPRPMRRLPTLIRLVGTSWEIPRYSVATEAVLAREHAAMKKMRDKCRALISPVLDRVRMERLRHHWGIICYTKSRGLF
ncbi:uncharacterized [Tachysurus ichikawai]